MDMSAQKGAPWIALLDTICRGMDPCKYIEILSNLHSYYGVFTSLTAFQTLGLILRGG